ncbi:MAG: adenylate/guanylate cyclase domain-containing protein [Gammaproteobacteria bacterium]
MLTVAVVVLLLTTVSAMISGHSNHVRDLVLGTAAILVAVNLIGARMLFTPVARYLAGRVDIRVARPRLLKLAFLSALWAALLVFVFMSLQFFFHHVWYLRFAPNLLELLVYPAILIAIFAIFAGLFVYFLIADFTVRLREEIFSAHHVVVEPGEGRVLHKLIIAFFVVSIVPMSLLFYRLYFFEDFPHLQGLEVGQFIQTDIFAATLLVGIAVIFISRNLTRPVTTLLLSMNRLSAGDMKVRTPVISDDEIGRLSVGFNSMAEKLEEQGFIRETFGKFVPESIAATVLADRGIVRPQLREATILFTDIEGFTAICEKLSPEQVITMLNEYFAAVAEPVRDAGGVITQFQGDAMLASFNLPVEDPHHAASAVRAALEIQRITRTRRFVDDNILKTRIGINTGVVVGGTVGDGDHLGYTVHGDVVNLAARLEQLNKDYGSHILIAQRTAQLAGDGFAFMEVGKTAIRGHENTILVYEVPIP